MSGDGPERSTAGRRGGVGRGLRFDGRAQTVLDFVVGMSVFLTAVGFTFAFVPSLLEPYAVGEGATVIVAERGAARLAESSLVVDGPTATLSTACTLGFFDGAAAGDDCAWTASADDLHAELGVADRRGLNLTLTQNGTVGTLDPDGRDGDPVPMRAGPAPPRSESVSAASRIVALDADGDGERETHRLTLRVW